MSLIRPRLNDFHNLPFTQEEVDFAIPFLNEDIPLYVDPFLLWRSPSQSENGLHVTVADSLNYLGRSYQNGEKQKALSTLITISECDEVGLGNSPSRRGKPIGEKTAREILELYKDVPQISKSGITHVEEIQLLVDNVARDRISDITCSFLKNHLIDYTASQCHLYGIPCRKVELKNIFKFKQGELVSEEVELPINPETDAPILLVPKRWLRYIPWINYDDYFAKATADSTLEKSLREQGRLAILNFNRQNYDLVRTYIQAKERNQSDCKTDPLFSQLPVLSTKRLIAQILKLPIGKEDGADKTYEDKVDQLLASLLYPQLDFAATQSRTDEGMHIRDLIFYNNHSTDFLKEIYDSYNSRQLVFELKNVKEVSTENVNQLNRYLSDHLGKFGVIVTRKPPSDRVIQNTIHLWSAQRKCILFLTDDDLAMMCSVFENKQRLPIEVLKMKFVEFHRRCPS